MPPEPNPCRPCQSSPVPSNAYDIMEFLSVSTTPAGCASPVSASGSVFGFGLPVVLFTFPETVPFGIVLSATASIGVFFSAVCSAAFLAGAFEVASDAVLGAAFASFPGFCGVASAPPLGRVCPASAFRVTVFSSLAFCPLSLCGTVLFCVSALFCASVFCASVLFCACAFRASVFCASASRAFPSFPSASMQHSGYRCAGWCQAGCPSKSPCRCQGSR